jgi:hypothetical protein
MIEGFGCEISAATEYGIPVPGVPGHDVRREHVPLMANSKTTSDWRIILAVRDIRAEAG